VLTLVPELIVGEIKNF